jgi:hypothetical protein
MSFNRFTRYTDIEYFQKYLVLIYWCGKLDRLLSTDVEGTPEAYMDSDMLYITWHIEQIKIDMIAHVWTHIARNASIKTMHADWLRDDASRTSRREDFIEN